MMGGAAALAVQTGAALMPVALWFERLGLGRPHLPRDPGAYTDGGSAGQDRRR